MQIVSEDELYVLVDRYNMTIRTYNVLRRGYIDTVGKLCNLTLLELSELRWCGSSACYEIYTILKQLYKDYGVKSKIALERDLDEPKIKSLYYKGKYLYTLVTKEDIKTNKIHANNYTLYVNDFRVIPNKIPHIKTRNYNIVVDRLYNKKTYEDIGKEYGITKQSIERIYKNTLRQALAQYKLHEQHVY